jgi:hypothetical protein
VVALPHLDEIDSGWQDRFEWLRRKDDFYEQHSIIGPGFLFSVRKPGFESP